MDSGIEAQIREWRSYLLRRRTIHRVDVDELEDHLRSQISDLGAAGLSEDESFLVAIKRIGAVNDLSREFARERSSRLWKQLVLAGDGVRERPGSEAIGLLITVCFAIAAALAFKLPALFGLDPFAPGTSDSTGVDGEASFYLRNSSLLVLPFLIGFLAWRRNLPPRVIAGLALPFIAAAILVNVFPFDTGGDTEVLVAIHLPIILWLVAGVAYLGGAWRFDAPRMDFVRFTGEWFIYYTLIAFGGFVLCALTLGLFEAIEIDVAPIISSWVLPCGAVGAVVVVAWLVEAKRSVIENMAPVLTGVFTPLFALMLIAAIFGMALTGNVIHADRDVLILLDLLLVVVTGLVLYSISARDPETKPTIMDAVQLVLLVSALVIDMLVLAAMLSRTTEFGFTPNRMAGLGLNVVLLANLAWSAWLLSAFLRARRPVRRPGALADQIHPRVRGLGSRRGRGVPAAVRVRITSGRARCARSEPASAAHSLRECARRAPRRGAGDFSGPGARQGPWAAKADGFRPLLNARPRLWGVRELPPGTPSSKRPGAPESRFLLFVVADSDPPAAFYLTLGDGGRIQSVSYGCGSRPELAWQSWATTGSVVLSPPAAPRPR